jgi:hypothetical protein
MLFAIKADLVSRYELSVKDQESIIQDFVEEVTPLISTLLRDTNKLQSLKKDVFVTKVRAMPIAIGSNSREQPWQPRPALKVCMTSGLTKKEVESAGTNIRRSLHVVMERRKFKR